MNGKFVEFLRGRYIAQKINSNTLTTDNMVINFHVQLNIKMEVSITR